MLWTSFSPGLDGAADWAFTEPEGQSTRQVERAFRAARAQVLEELHRPYFNAVETYNLAGHTGRWLEITPFQDCSQDAGKIYATLDYFSACLPLPRRMKALGARKEAVFYRYFHLRSLENIQANTLGFLNALTISCLIPDEWFPEKDLEKIIEKEIRQLGMYGEVEVDCQLRLAPGGLRWLAGSTMQTLENIREKLAAGQPWPVRIVRSPGKLLDNRQAIVYACQEQPGGRTRLEIFDPGCILEEHALQVDVSGEQVDVVEIAPPGPSLPVFGLLWEAYSPTTPPLECSPRWLRREAVRQVWRKLRKGFRGNVDRIFTGETRSSSPFPSPGRASTNQSTRERRMEG